MAVVSAEPKPSYEELLAENVALKDVLAKLEARIAELEARLNQNSKNSSRPPSSDSPFLKPAPKSLRGEVRAAARTSGRPAGGDVVAGRDT
jgi:hypothetical protein